VFAHVSSVFLRFPVEAFARALPPGAMNFVSGRGRETMPPLMKTGDIDGLAFIGGSNAADDLIRQHPHPHRLKVFLQLEAKNMGVSIGYSRKR
jgi:glyceraldehyde-3-phosphate dehydrogenase (NADP+)